MLKRGLDKIAMSRLVPLLEFDLVGAMVVAGWLAWRRSFAAPAWRAFDGARAFEDL
jgi:hypothetical protein